MEHKTAIQELLVRAESAHTDYEKTVLNGVYDREWARWYAEWLITHHLNEHLSTVVTVDSLSNLLVDLYAQYQQSSQSQPWAQFYAEQMAGQNLVR